ncbi:MAG: translation initiation factor IF-2 [Spirochaetaceae bacterium]|nr:translation initiation factor IF-2 [Spirochaetaceae bacterium]
MNVTNPVPKSIDIMEVITVSELARKMNLKASDLISKLMGMGMMVTINQQIDAETAQIIADDYECKINIVSLYDETIIESEEDIDKDLKSRPPIVTVMGHVDHGKTKLLDAIRSTNVVAGEFGGITQHKGAYTVETPKGPVTFLDTPGHSAFTMMRSRGAQITDIVILVVAANDGVMPQTKEAVSHAKEAGVPIVVAVNKTDLPEANPDRVKQQLSELNIIAEDWAGSVQFINISALKKTGIKELLDAVQLESEMLDLKANWDCRAEGKVIESKVDQGRGTVSTILVQRGVLRVGDSFVAGVFNGKIRAMFDDKGEKLMEAPPSTPVEIIGISGVPNSGDPFQVTSSDREAKQFSAKRLELRKVEGAKNVKKITLDNLYDSIQDGEIQELKVIIKGDVHGSVEALQSALEKLSTKEIRLACIRAGAGAIIEDDVYLASASNAIIVGFHVRPTAKAQSIAEAEKVDIRKYNIIYDAVEDIRSAMEGMLAPELKEEVSGMVEIRETFKVPKIGVIAGCMVTSGTITRKSQVHVYREGVEVYTGGISSLKRFKDDAKEVREGFECGLSIDGFQDIKVGDQVEVFNIREIARNLGESTSGE